MAILSISFHLFVSNIVMMSLAFIVSFTTAERLSPRKIYLFDTRRGLVETSGGSVVDVTSFGAKVNDPMFDHAQVFIQVWNATCNKGAGPAKMIIPPGTYVVGQVVFQGPCIANPITIEVQGTIRVVADPSVYPNGGWIQIENINGVVLKGGIFDGQETNLNITAPNESPNTDGIHISTTNNVNIMNSHIGIGDDCVGIIQGSSNIFISNVHCGPGHGLSIGSLGKYPNEKDVTGVHVRNCTLVGTTNGVRIKTFPGDLRIQASNIVFEDIVMDGAKNPIIIDQSYGRPNALAASGVKMSDVHFKNIRGTSISLVDVDLECSKLFPCEDVELANIDLTYTGTKAGSISALCNNTKPIYTGKQNPHPCPVT